MKIEKENEKENGGTLRKIKIKSGVAEDVKKYKLWLCGDCVVFPHEPEYLIKNTSYYELKTVWREVVLSEDLEDEEKMKILEDILAQLKKMSEAISEFKACLYGLQD